MMGSVYRMCEELLARLPVDESGRRVFVETLADWRREPGAMRGLVAVGRAVAGVAYTEVASASMCRTWFHILAWSTAWVVLGIGIIGAITGFWGSSLSGLAAWSVSGYVFFLPTAIVLSFAGRRRMPVTGLVLVSTVTALLLVGWALPAANRVTFGPIDPFLLASAGFEERAASGAQAVFQTIWPRLSLEYISGRYAHDLPALVAAGPPNGWAAVQLLSFNAAFVSLCALMPLVGFALSYRRIWSRRAAVALTVAFVSYRGQIADIVAPDWVLWNFVAPWLPVVAIAVVLIALWKTPAEASATIQSR